MSILAAALYLASPVSGQDAGRSPVSVDYVGVEGVYLSVGTDHGVAIGDTLALFASATASTPLGRVLLRNASRRRSVTTPLEPRPAIARGDTVWIETGAVTADPADSATAGASDPAPVAREASTSDAPTPRSSSPRVRGRLSVDLDARESHVSWQGDLFGSTRRRMATPASHLSFTIEDLPGGLRIETSARASYRYSDIATITPTTSVRVYDFAAIKTFGTAPLEMRMGRFYNPYEPYSAYWDGALLRIGRRTGPAVGIVAGFEPRRRNEAPASDVGKLTVFAELATRGSGWRYDTDASFHLLGPPADSLDRRTFFGWSQRIGVRRLSFDQRLRVERDPGGGAWALAQLRLRGGVAVAGPARIVVTYARSRPALLGGIAFEDARERIEIVGGVHLLGSGGSLALDVGSSRWGDDEPGLALAASTSADVGPIRLHASGRRWTRSEWSSLSWAPGLGTRIRGFDVRTGYRFYRTGGSTVLTSHSADLSVTRRLTTATTLSVGGERQWGRTYRGTRLRVRVWRSF